MKKSLLFTLMLGTAALVAACTPPDTGGGAGPAGLAPVAVIAPSTTSGGAPLSVTFDASSSVDPDADGTIVSYVWDFGDSTTGVGETVNHVFAEGTWRTQLVVTDNTGKIGTAFVDITVTNLAPVADIVVNTSTGAAPLTVTFDGSGSSDPDGSIASYAWTFTDQAPATGATVTRTFPAGTFTATLTVTDQAGKTATTSRTVTATGAPAAPTGLQRVGQGCCNTYGDFTWNQVPGANAYEIRMDGFFLGGCVTDHSAVIEGQVGAGRVQAAGLCLGSQYDVSIRARSNGVWGPWSDSFRITL